MKKYCPVCNKDIESEIIQKEETYAVRDKIITVEADVCICPTCKTDLCDMVLDDMTLNKVYDEYFKITGVEIRRSKLKEKGSMHD